MIRAGQEDGAFYEITVSRSESRRVAANVVTDAVARISIAVAGHPKLTDEEIYAVVALVRARLEERRGTDDTALQ